MTPSVPAPAGEAPDDLTALRWALAVARSTEWQPDGNGGPNKCFTCGAYSTQGHNRPCARFDKFAAAEAAVGASGAPGRDAPPTKPWLEPRSLITKARDALVGTEYFLNEERHAAQRSHNRALVRDLNEYLGVSP